MLEDAELEAGIAEQVANAKAILGETVSLQCTAFVWAALDVSAEGLLRLSHGAAVRSCADLRGLF